MPLKLLPVNPPENSIMENSVPTSYPVKFFDGEQEIDIGNVIVHSSLHFNTFQNVLAQKIGYPSQQISTILICRKSFKSPKNQKIPINYKTSFASILSQHNPTREDCFFQVILKKPRKERKGRSRRDFEDVESKSSRDDLSPPPFPPKNAKKLFPAPEKTLLRRDPKTTSFLPLKPAFQGNRSPVNVDYWYQLERSGQISPFYSQIPVPERGYGFGDYENQGFSDWYGGTEERFGVLRCELCWSLKGQPVPFHFCVHDTITAGFRGPSPAGPIERPVKAHVGGAGAGDMKAAA